MGLENHNTDKPRHSPDFGRQHPKFVIAKLQEFIRQFGDKEFVLPNLSRRVRRRLNGSMEKYLIQARHIADREKETRLMRRERRQACAAVISAFLYVVDIKSCTCNIPLQKIADVCNIHIRRAERVIADLRAAGILQTIRRPAPQVTPTGRKYFCAVRRFTPAFLRYCLPGKLAEYWNKAGGSMPPYGSARAYSEMWRCAFAAHVTLPPKPPPGFALAAGTIRGWELAE